MVIPRVARLGSNSLVEAVIIAVISTLVGISQE